MRISLPRLYFSFDGLQSRSLLVVFLIENTYFSMKMVIAIMQNDAFFSAGMLDLFLLEKN